MKKTYIIPEMLVTSVALHQMIADSVKLGGGEQTTSGTSGGWTKEDNSWNVWDEDDFRDE